MRHHVSATCDSASLAACRHARAAAALGNCPTISGATFLEHGNTPNKKTGFKEIMLAHQSRIDGTKVVQE